MLRSTRRRYGSPTSCWKDMGFAFKFYFITSLLVTLASIPYPFSYFLFTDSFVQTVLSFQIWRPFLTFWGSGVLVLLNIFRVLLAFFWLMGILEEKKNSSIYTLLEIFLISLQINLLTLIFGFVLWLLFSYANVLCYGWYIIILVYQFHFAASDPEGDARFFCLPFQIKRKHFPWILTAILMLYGVLIGLFFAVLSAALIGYFEAYILKRHIILLPRSLYAKFENCLPQKITARQDFTKISAIEEYFSSLCIKTGGESTSPSKTTTSEKPRQLPNNSEIMENQEAIMSEEVLASEKKKRRSRKRKEISAQNHWQNRDKSDGYGDLNEEVQQGEKKESTMERDH